MLSYNKVLLLNFWILLLSSIVMTGMAAVSTSSSVLQKMAPCSSANATSQPCISRNNCSGRQQSEGCVMVVSVPPGQQQFEHQLMDVLNINMEKPTTFEVWSLGLASVGIISLSGVTGAVLWPLINSPLYKYIMAILIGLAVGSLTSTALFQLIPEAFKLTASVENYLNTALFGWLSLWIIFVIESVSKLAFNKSKDKPLPKIKEMTRKEESVLLKDRIQNSSHEHQILTKPKSKKIGAVAWMIIFGDGLHNFIDGMTIGAGYSLSIATGIGLSIAIACEEFPHELVRLGWLKMIFSTFIMFFHLQERMINGDCIGSGKFHWYGWSFTIGPRPHSCTEDNKTANNWINIAVSLREYRQEYYKGGQCKDRLVYPLVQGLQRAGHRSDYINSRLAKSVTTRLPRKVEAAVIVLFGNAEGVLLLSLCGDFAILLQSGMSVSRALCYNFLSACTAFFGLALGILLGQLEESHYIFAFAGGLFLYISLSHLIPELKSILKEQLKKGKRYCFVYIILQNLGIILGATLIYFITRYNDLITGV